MPGDPRGGSGDSSLNVETLLAQIVVHGFDSVHQWPERKQAGVTLKSQKCGAPARWTLINDLRHLLSCDCSRTFAFAHNAETATLLGRNRATSAKPSAVGVTSWPSPVASEFGGDSLARPRRYQFAKPALFSICCSSISENPSQTSAKSSRACS